MTSLFLSLGLILANSISGLADVNLVTMETCVNSDYLKMRLVTSKSVGYHGNRFEPQTLITSKLSKDGFQHNPSSQAVDIVV